MDRSEIIINEGFNFFLLRFKSLAVIKRSVLTLDLLPLLPQLLERKKNQEKYVKTVVEIEPVIEAVKDIIVEGDQLLYYQVAEQLAKIEELKKAK